MNEIISHISFINGLVVINLLLLIFSIKYKKYIKIFIGALSILICIMIHLYLFFNQKINISENEIEYNNSSELIKYHSRINLHKKVFLLRDSFLNSNDIKEVNNAKYSSIEHLFYLTRFENSQFFNSDELESYKFYYQLCLFYENNNCNHFTGFYGDNSYQIDSQNIREQKNNIELLPFDLKYLIIPNNKEELIKLNYKVGQFLNVKNLSCLNLFYGSQNRWKNYQKQLIENLKNEKNNICLNEILSNFEIKKTNKTKETLINFLENFKNEKDLDFEIENNKINLESAIKKVNTKSIYYELLIFIYKDSKINNIEEIIIQLSYLKNFININKIIKSYPDKKEYLIKIIKSYPDKSQLELKTYEMNFINEKYELLKYLEKIS